MENISKILPILLLFVLMTSSCNSTHADKPIKISAHAEALASKLHCIQRGIASWYGTNLKGHLTASGKKFNPKALTAASRSFPFGTKLIVTNLQNERDVLVTVTDRGPYSHKRIIDISTAAAKELDMKKSGLAPVCIQKAEE